ncbi:MAG: PTS glucitol/sorbitol transporter subunit IIA [Eubacteriaceae bacterium]
MDYKSVVVNIGEMATELIDEGILIVFNEDAPEVLAEISVLHTITEMFSEVRPKDIIVLGKKKYTVTGVGEEANATLKSMGHCTFKFSGKEVPDLPGQIELKGEGYPEVKIGDVFEIHFM